MIAGGNHTLIKEADVAISRYDVCSCTAVRWMVPGDSQEVNCPEGAREATLGCGPNGPRNDRKTASVPITVSLRGVLQSAADFSITMIAEERRSLQHLPHRKGVFFCTQAGALAYSIWVKRGRRKCRICQISSIFLSFCPFHPFPPGSGADLWKPEQNLNLPLLSLQNLL